MTRIQAAAFFESRFAPVSCAFLTLSCRFDGRDVDLVHRQHCLERALGRSAIRISFCGDQGNRGGLRAPYRTLELPGADPLKDAHAALDAAVLAAYGFNPKKDLLALLLALNLDIAARIAHSQPVTGPGIPKNHTEPKRPDHRGLHLPTIACNCVKTILAIVLLLH